MQKSGIKFWEWMPRTIVPLDSALIFILYTKYDTVFLHFYQHKNVQKSPMFIFYCKFKKITV